MAPQDERAEEILATAMEITAPAARCAYLDQTCVGDNALRQEVESLLAADEQAGAFMTDETISAALRPLQTGQADEHELRRFSAIRHALWA
jgi:hypothetical protein